MPVASDDDLIAESIANVLVEGFNKHYRLFRESSARAKQRFEEERWQEGQQAIKERIQFYDNRVGEKVERLRREFNADSLGDALWQRTKLYFIGLLINHKQPELGETFFNSVFCRIRHRTYFHNDFIFVRSAVSTEYILSDPPAFRCYYPNHAGVRASVRQVFIDFRWSRKFEDLDRDVDYLLRSIESHLGVVPAPRSNLQIQVLNSAFYRNKGAYVIGKVVNSAIDYPFLVPVLHATDGRLYLDTIIMDVARIRALFSLSRAYFMVDMDVPSGYVQFLGSIMPNKPHSEIYTMLGLGKQGKTMFYRDLIFHLHHSSDQFIVAPGIRGMVMLVFTLPSYPYVFKVIKDVFGSTKEVDHETVRHKYQIVKQVDRVGRMADTLEFSKVALPRKRFSQELIDELFREVPSQLEDDGDELVIEHLYIERRMEPLNIYLERAERSGRDDLLEDVVREYGNAIRELAIANIFPGDLLWKNFGVAHFGRVVFYDYDEIEFMTDCNFRRIPPAPNFEAEMSGEVWYSVSRLDIFPEEFATFLLVSKKIRDAFMRYHGDLLDVAFWQGTQERIRQGVVQDFFPYPESMRFSIAFAGGGSR